MMIICNEPENGLNPWRIINRRADDRRIVWSR